MDENKHQMELHQTPEYQAIVKALKLPTDDGGTVLAPMPFWREVMWHLRHWRRS